MPRKIIGDLAIVAAALCLSLFAAEGLLRISVGFLPEAVLAYAHRDVKLSIPSIFEKVSKSINRFGLRIPDSDLGWRFAPDIVLSGANEDGESYNFRISSEGFLTPSQPAKTEKQLITIGDSFMATFYVMEPVAHVIQRKTGAPVYNVAVGGWGPNSQINAYKKYASGRSGGKVAVFGFLNDITDVENWKKWKSEGGDISFYEHIKRTSPALKTQINVEDSYLDRKSLLWNLAKYAFVKASTKSTPETAGDLEHIKVGGVEFDLRFTKGYVFMTHDPKEFIEGGSYHEYMKRYFDVITELDGAINADGKKMVFFWIPAKERVYLPLLPQGKFREYVTNKTGAIDGVELALKQFFDENGIAFYDLVPRLEKLAAGGGKLYFTNDGHLNSEGNRIVGEMAAEIISRSPD